MNAPVGRNREDDAMPHSMRVLMTVDAVGGVWRQAMELARPLRRLGVSVVFAGLGPEHAAAAMAEARHLGEVAWTGLPLDWMAQEPGQLDGVSAALEELAHRSECGLLHLNLPSQAAGLVGRLPTVVMSHSCVPTWWRAMREGPLPEHLRWHAELNARGFANADAVLAPSFSHAEALHRCYGASPHLKVAHNGIAAFLSADRREHFVLAAGRFWDEAKNGSVIDAAARAVRWPVLMAGSCQDPQGGRVDYGHAQVLGEIPHSEVISLARRAGIFVSASRYEPFGLAPLEAARSGAPLVLSDIPTYRELWRGAALFFKAQDPDALAGCLNRLAGDPALRDEMGLLALARSRQYTPDRQARAVCDVYGEVKLGIAAKADA